MDFVRVYQPCTTPDDGHSSDQKLRDFRLPYLKKSIIIHEHLNLGKISRFIFRIEMIQMKS